MEDDEAFYARLAVHARLPYLSLEPGPGGDPVDPAAARLLGAPAARAYGIVPVALDADRLVVAVADPDDCEALAVASELTRRVVTPVLAAPAAIERAQNRVYGPRPEPEPVRPARAARRRPRPDPSRGERRRYALLARHAGLEFVSLEPGPGGDPVDPAAARALPERVCRLCRVLPIEAGPGRLTVATDDPAGEARGRVVFALTGDRAHVVVTTPSELERAIERVFRDEPGQTMT